ncbi:L-threonine synthase [Ekhidna lutea]|uniref:Threonine synthase n=1 Tax=Ekhidna lutea TaxID=447679 RepID=A0A239LP23_EKHLU|nr:threonine synthase [Ekhidna lutea]SNT31563.1 L-threonine synthase [Ekhidna lutea]
MKFKSTTGQGPEVSFREAVLNNLPNDGGLYFPKEIRQLEKGFIKEIPKMHLSEIAFEVLSKFCTADIRTDELEEITERVFDFPIPLVQVNNKTHCLELFHGPTFAFKDIGAKFLAECLAHFNAGENKETTVLVATSGDTGGAVANGFLGVEGVRVVILYPKGKVSELQEKQLTTLGQNITALEIEGTFDDCQNLVKQAFADEQLNKKLHLSSANSINIARWLPQSLFFYVPLQQGFEDVTIAVPSGNYGNLTSGVLAMKMGVPIKQFVAASNANDVVPRYLQSGNYEPEDTIQTIANAMDVSDPSNFKRLLSLFDRSYQDIKNHLKPFTLDDDAIKQTIRECHQANEYLLDPHGAIAYAALHNADEEGIFLGTAHYCKFLPTLKEALREEVPIPDFAKDLMTRKKQSTRMKADYALFKEFLNS